jgi:hypothetical protein
VSVRSERTEVELDDERLDRDFVYWGAMAAVIAGSDFGLPLDFVPADLRVPNAVFWLTVGNDGRRRLYRRPEDEIPAAVGPVPARR